LRQVSIFDGVCGVNTSGSICAHVLQFYPQKFEEPIIFWAFDSANSLPVHATIVQQNSKTGDVCHHNIQGINREESKSIIYAVLVNDCSICDNGNVRQLSLKDLEF
jgi:hypothetical protein